uniref:RGS domain-containing protein n=1 Tax=Macrostomum lignano TaxID=282301 RepID=A0A1I8GE88_9PLAT
RSQDCLLPAASAAVTTGSSGGRSQDCLLPAASAAVTTGSSGGGRSLLRVLPSTSAARVLRANEGLMKEHIIRFSSEEIFAIYLSSRRISSVEMRLSNVHYAAADAQDARVHAGSS